jgi:hypothetical protein
VPGDTSRSIGAVTDLLARQLRARTTVLSVTQGRPEPPPSETSSKINVLLYEAVPDGTLRSHSLEGRPAPVWLALRYLVTAFSGGSSDSAEAHRILGEAIRALHGMAYLQPTSDMSIDDVAALRANPEPLKLTFVPAASELLGRLMQGSDEKYRCSIAVEIRPVMIAGATASEASLLVGVPQRPPSDDRAPGVVIALAPIATPVLTAVAPMTFEAGQPLRLSGTGFAAGDRARLAGAEDTITLEGEHFVARFTHEALASETAPGALPLAIARLVASSTGSVTLPRRYRSSAPIIVRLAPTLTSVAITTRRLDAMASEPGRVILELELRGLLLGRPEDDTIVSLWAGGRTVANSDELVELAGAPQTARQVTIRDVPTSAAPYRVIVRVNGSQAASAPEIAVAP